MGDKKRDGPPGWWPRRGSCCPAPLLTVVCGTTLLYSGENMGKVRRNSGSGQRFLATRNQPARQKVSRLQHPWSGDLHRQWPALHVAAVPTIRSRSERLRMPSYASQSWIVSTVARTPRVPGCHHQGAGASPSCARHPTAALLNSPEYSIEVNGERRSHATSIDT